MIDALSARLQSRERSGANLAGHALENVIRILIVEDEVITRFAMEEALRDLGMSVAAYQDAESALSNLATATFDAAIIDVALPGLRGDEFAHQCLQDHPAMAIILVTGFDAQQISRLFPSGSRVVTLEKPFEFAVLRDCLERLGMLVSDKASIGST
jgi:CheY-like chemotaxis protein